MVSPGLGFARTLYHLAKPFLPRFNPGGQASEDGDHAVEATVEAREVVTVREYDPAVVRREVPWWDALTPAEKAQEARHLEPESEHVSDNTTCVELHELCVDMLDGARNVHQPITELAIGSSDAAPDPADRTLGNEITRLQITAFDNEGTSLSTRSFLSQNTANGETIREVGLIATDMLLNHSLLGSPIEKDAGTEATISARLTFAAN